MALDDAPRRVLIQSDGSAVGTHVFDEAGHEIVGRITKIEWSIDAENLATAVLTFSNVEIFAPAVVTDQPDETTGN